MPQPDGVSHLMQDRCHSARRGAPDLLPPSGSADNRFALPAEVVRIEIEADVIGLIRISDELNVRECAVELRDGGIEIGGVARSSRYDVRNLILSSRFQP